MEFVSYLGATTEYVVRLASGDLVAVEVHNTEAGAAEPLTIGAQILINWDPNACHANWQGPDDNPPLSLPGPGAPGYHPGKPGGPGGTGAPGGGPGGGGGGGGGGR